MRQRVGLLHMAREAIVVSAIHVSFSRAFSPLTSGVFVMVLMFPPIVFVRLQQVHGSRRSAWPTRQSPTQR